MKKIYSFIALMLMCFMGATTVQAQQNWAPGDASVTEDEFVAGPDHLYLLQEGDNTKLDENGEETTDGHSNSLFYCNIDGAHKMAADPTEASVVSFVEVGTNNAGFPIYVMQHYATKKYISKSGLVDTKAEAYTFGIRKAVAVPEDGAENGKDATWEQFSNIVSESRSLHAVENGAWVLCAAESKEYIGFIGDGFSFESWIDTNNWYIYTANPEEMPAEQKLNDAIEKYYGSISSADDLDELYPVGTEPGCVSEEFLQSLKDTYSQADAMRSSGSATDEQYLEMADYIVNLFEVELPKNLKSVVPGYFVLKNVGERGFLTVFDNGKGRGNKALATKNVEEGTDYASWTPAATTTWNLDNAKYIWKLENSKEDGKLLFQNFGTGKYLATDADYQTVDNKDAAVPFKVSNFKGQEFIITFGSNGMVHVANHSDNKLLNYNDPNDVASRWVFYEINNEIVDSLSAKVAQNALNEDLKAALDDANNDYYSNQYENYVQGDSYKDTLDAGLVDSVLLANATEKKEGSLSNLFDGNMTTYYHTAWDTTSVQDLKAGDPHWIQVDLGKDVSEMILKFSKRQNAANGHISEYALYTPADGNPDNADWDKLVASSDTLISYQYGKNNTHIDTVKFESPVRYLRFVVKQTRGRDSSTWNKMTKETGPFWHMSELRFYDKSDIKTNPAYDEIPAEVKNALLAAIEKGEAELAEKKATQATIDEIEACLKAFWAAYPDASGLKRDLENAAAMVEYATEMEEPTMGFYPIGAKDALLEFVNTIQANIKLVEDAGKVLSLKEIEEYTAQLDAAVAEFNSKLVKPEAGKVYFIVGKSVVDDAEAPQVDGCVASIDADVKNGTPVFRYKADGTESLDERFNALWLAEETEGGLAFKNLANGLYMNNVYAGLTEEQIDSLELPNNQIGYSNTPKAFQLESFSKEGYADQGYFIMTLMKGQYLNFQQAGKVMVHYTERNDANAPLTFVEAEDPTDGIDFQGNYHLDVEAGKVQILSYPIDLESVETADGNGAFEVVGRNGDNIMLKPFEGTIAACTPFIVKTQAANEEEGVEAENKIAAMLTAVTLGDALNLNHFYDSVVKNGLVSTLQNIELGDGFGILVNGTVIPSKAGATVGAGHGYFNNTLVETAEETEFMIPVEGVISGGDATGVENVEIVKNVASDVYTVSGVKVRSNVKLSNATQGLPKGVYIVAGKKVIVK